MNDEHDEGLVILLGVNNSGKFNLVSVIEKSRKQNIEEKDYTYFAQSSKSPHIHMKPNVGPYTDKDATGESTTSEDRPGHNGKAGKSNSGNVSKYSSVTK
ncbi:MAG: hypothetical protein MJY54_01300 [archaeon]|nr:hypothetical protein [archaeon]